MDVATVDHLLTTTRSVRKRLDFSRPVDPAIIERCIAIALQAPTGSNMQGWHFLVVTDAAKRARLSALGRIGHDEKVPALHVRAGRRLQGDGDAALDDRRVDRPGEVEPLAHRAGGGEQMIDGGDVHDGILLFQNTEETQMTQRRMPLSAYPLRPLRLCGSPHRRNRTTVQA